MRFSTPWCESLEPRGNYLGKEPGHGLLPALPPSDDSITPGGGSPEGPLPAAPRSSRYRISLLPQCAHGVEVPQLEGKPGNTRGYNPQCLHLKHCSHPNKGHRCPASSSRARVQRVCPGSGGVRTERSTAPPRGVPCLEQAQA